MTDKNRKKIKVRVKSTSEPDPEPQPELRVPTPEPKEVPDVQVADEDIHNQIEDLKRQQSSTNFKLNLLVVALTAVGLFCGRGCIRKLIH